MNLASWIIVGILVVIVGLSIYFGIKNRKKGCSCCSKTDDCPYCDKK